ncbi:GNAT family N-acetyltransferase [Mesorhizobium sp. 1B3]|uniref:GNAT family N-acetyltransferase n=1 Tax=Mesorhizobium sp. 1B3 TaxID=3243599 RepID=UPI003D97567A
MVRLLVTYMELCAPPCDAVLAPSLAAVCIAKEVPAPEEYLELYRAVGTPLQWDDRLRMPRDELCKFIASSMTSIYVLRIEGRSVGLCEFEGVGTKSVELKHFGLTPGFQGRGLGSYLLNSALRSVWSCRPERIWLHTDTNDHPKAKSTYERAGFKAYAEVWEEFPD